MCIAEPDSQRPHPAAPSELQKSFGDFLKKFQASSPSPSKSGSGGNVVSEFWEAPSRFWKTSIRELEDAEIEAITVSIRLCKSALTCLIVCRVVVLRYGDRT